MFVFTFPKLKLAVLALSVTVEPVSCSAKVCETPFALAVSVAVCAVFAAVTVAVKLALIDPAATLTDAGTVTELLLLAKAAVNPPLAAATLSVTMQLSVPAPVIELLEQVNPVRAGTPVPLKLTAAELPAEELLVNVSDPFVAPAADGSNWTVRVAV